MNINLVSLLAQYLTPELVGRIAAALGVDRTLLGKAATALAPALLRVLAGLAATPAGARRLAGAVEKQDPGILASLESAIGGSGQESLVKGGIGALESLLGGASGVTALSGALSMFSGLGQEAASALIGLVTPTALGALHKEQAAQGLDASGLARLLEAQKDNIAKALPAEFGDLLGKSGLPGFEAPAAPSPRIERPAAVTAPEAAPQGFNWRWIAAAVAAIALASSWYLSNRPAVEEQKTAAGPARTLTVDGVDLNSSVQTAFNGIKEALQSVRDTASAQAALPQLEKGSIEFDKLRDLASKLPFDAKSTFALLVAQLRPSIEELFNKVLEIPGVAPIAKPVIDRLRAKLDVLSKPESKA